MKIGIRKLTREQFNDYKQRFNNGEWLFTMKYGFNAVTVRGIKKSKTYEDYIGKHGLPSQSSVDGSIGTLVKSDADELAKWAELHQQGLLSDAEFAAKKKQLLALEKDYPALEKRYLWARTNKKSSLPR